MFCTPDCRRAQGAGRELKTLLEHEPELAWRLARLCTIKGLGQGTAVSRPNCQCQTAHCLAPYANDSGHHHGRGGRFEVRIALYGRPERRPRPQRLLPAFATPAKVALTAVMRKLLCLAQRLLQNPNFALAPQHSCSAQPKDQVARLDAISLVWHDA